MRFARLAWRPLLVLAAAIGVGMWTTEAVAHRATVGGAPVAQVRLASWMAGLFAGGAAGCLVGIAVVWTRRDTDK